MLRQLFAVAQKVAPRAQRILFARLDIGALKLFYLILKAVAEPGLFYLVHGQRGHFLFYRGESVILGPVRRQRAVQMPEAVQIRHVAALIHKLPPVVLPVDIHQHRGQLLELRRRNRRAADAAAALSVKRYAPLYNKLSVGVDLVLLQPRGGAVRVKNGSDSSLFSAAPDKVAADALSEDCPDRVDYDRFARARFTRKHVESGGEAYIRFFYYSYILNVQFIKHTASSLPGRPGKKSKQNFYLMVEAVRRFVVAHGNERRVVARDGSNQPVYLHAVQRGAAGRRKSGGRFYDDDILRQSVGDKALPEHGLEPRAEIIPFGRRGRFIAVVPVRPKLLCKAHILYVSRQRSLRALYSPLGQRFHKLCLRFNVLLRDNFKNDALSASLHAAAS